MLKSKLDIGHTKQTKHTELHKNERWNDNGKDTDPWVQKKNDRHAVTKSYTIHNIKKDMK